MSQPLQRSAAIVIIGNEVLSGKVEEANSAFLIRRFRELGVRLGRVEIIPDDVAEIGRAVRAASDTFDIVITTGGVGPTHDDITMASIAAAFQVAVIRHPELLTLIEGFFGPSTTEAHRTLADVPEGAHLVGQERPPWPSVCFRNVYILPGIPKLMQARFNVFASTFAGPPLFYGALELQAFEAEICDVLNEVVASSPTVEIGSYPRREDGTWFVRLTMEGPVREDVEQTLRRLNDALGARVHSVEKVIATCESSTL
ncbi:MAG: competence/damage-inducible protein A [Myxococcota bacterium]